jgi:hypothetical protein
LSVLHAFARRRTLPLSISPASNVVMATRFRVPGVTMKQTISRLVLALCSLLLLFGAFAHARAFRGASAAIDHTNLRTIYAQDFKTLWLADSTTLAAVALFLAMLAIRPAVSRRALLVIVALIPAATAVLIYTFVGSFYAGHLLLGTAVAAAIAGFGDSTG